MRRTATAVPLLLLLLLPSAWQDGEAARSEKSVILSEELKELRYIIYDQGTMLAETKTLLKDVIKENLELRTKTQKQIKETLGKLEDFSKEMSAQGTGLQAMKKELGKLKQSGKGAGGPKVAFSAALGLPAGLRGPFGYQTTVIYRNVITNIGNAYNPSSGVFTAPVKGVYYFRFTGGVYDNESWNIGVNLYKNQEHLIHLGENSVDGIAKHVSTGITLEMKAGDQVYTCLPVNYVLWDDRYFRTSFSGFLLFTM